MYLLIKRACRRGCVAGPKEASTTGGCGRPVRKLPSRLRGAEFYRNPGGFQRGSGGDPQCTGRRAITGQRAAKRSGAIHAHSQPEKRPQSHTRPQSGASRPASGRWRVRPGGQRASTAAETCSGAAEQFFEAVNCRRFLQDCERYITASTLRYPRIEKAGPRSGNGVPAFSRQDQLSSTSWRTS